MRFLRTDWRRTRRGRAQGIIRTVESFDRTAPTGTAVVIRGFSRYDQDREANHLAGGGLVQVKKGYEGRRPRTWVTITKAGRGALSAEMQALKALVARFEQATPPRVGPAASPPPPGIRST